MTKYYAVQKGRKPGIYESWKECQEQTDGYVGAVYKSFKTIEEAEEFIKQNGYGTSTKKRTKECNQKTECYDIIKVPEGTCIAYVDGSFNSKTNIYGYGVLFLPNNEIYQGTGNNTEASSMRNVAGELCGAMRAVKEAIQLGYKEIIIHHDYEGIAKWVTGQWKANLTCTQQYVEYMKKHQKKINIKFKKVAAHTGVLYNEKVDQLAKEAVQLNHK